MGCSPTASCRHRGVRQTRHPGGPDLRRDLLVTPSRWPRRSCPKPSGLPSAPPGRSGCGTARSTPSCAWTQQPPPAAGHAGAGGTLDRWPLLALPALSGRHEPRTADTGQCPGPPGDAPPPGPARRRAHAAGGTRRRAQACTARPKPRLSRESPACRSPPRWARPSTRCRKVTATWASCSPKAPRTRRLRRRSTPPAGGCASSSGRRLRHLASPVALDLSGCRTQRNAHHRQDQVDASERLQAGEDARLGLALEQAELHGSACRLGAGATAELGQDVADVHVDGARAEEQLPGDLAVGAPDRDKAQHLDLTP